MWVLLMIVSTEGTQPQLKSWDTFLDSKEECELVGSLAMYRLMAVKPDYINASGYYYCYDLEGHILNGTSDEET